MRLAIDTNRYVDFAKGDNSALDRVRAASAVFVPLIVLGELRAGFAAGSQSESNEQNLLRFLNSDRVEVLYPDDGTTYQYARLFAQLKKQATPIPTNDLWIAAMVIQNDLILFSRDAHFAHLAQIARI